MALTDENGINVSMPVAPMGSYGGYGGGWGYPVMPVAGYGNNNGSAFGNDWSWILILFLFCFMGNGWGGNGFGGNGNNGAFPWLLASNTNSDNLMAAGFNQAATAGTLSGIQSSITGGFGDVQTAMCNGFSGVNQALCSGFSGVNKNVQNGFAQAEIADNARQMANMQQAFAAQTAATGAISGLSSQLAECCCENRLATQALQAVVQSENCADREALNTGIRDLLANQTAGTQRILDKLCDQELAAERRENDQLRQQLNMANLAASQTAQTAQLLADNARQTQQIENYVRPQVNPCYVVANPYAGYNNCGYGCGNGVGGFNGGF